MSTVEQEEERERAVRFWADRAGRLGALEPYATSFARSYVDAGATGDLGEAYDGWLVSRGWKTRAQMDADVARHAAEAELARSLPLRELVAWLEAGSPVPWPGTGAGAPD
ncbi:hypothetical protein ACH4F6_37880 [Streptomyces sp. NPDC017936]|uniref:hypothetical protein n=1 Tax=Streptomyces sp. NPDC017936 TaxID=3365016 RepID=UPI0037B3BD55